ncbi:hypothetical protein AB1Y20_019549 [Prymnesium parvum]|uniref:Chloride channel protein n=1 Tax=Prymnesium parvum TaxID=97485 RepID=A0AB34JUS9_PRYPA
MPPRPLRHQRLLLLLLIDLTTSYYAPVAPRSPLARGIRGSMLPRTASQAVLRQQAAELELASEIMPLTPATRDKESDQSSLSSRARFIAASIAVGALTGVTVSLFKLSIVTIAKMLYGTDMTSGWTGTDLRHGCQALFLPAVGGLAVAAIRLLRPRRYLGPGLACHVSEVELAIPPSGSCFATRGAAAAVTLGSGNSLGPEGPSVELGCGVSRLVGAAAGRGGWCGAAHFQRRQRQLLAAGAAAGVAAGFNTPLAGVFFALEVVAQAVRAAVDRTQGAMEAEGDCPTIEARRDSAELDVKSRTSISGIVLSAIISALVAQEILGVGHSLPSGGWPMRFRLMELPLYVGLGAISGLAALLFKRATAFVRGLFAEADAEYDTRGGALRGIPPSLRPAVGGLFCGLVGLAFPQVHFFGYAALDTIVTAPPLDATPLHASLGSPLMRGIGDGLALGGTLLPGAGLLLAKLATTSAGVASGLVGGTFAPSLLLGASVGVVYQQMLAATLKLVATVMPAMAGVGSVANVPAFGMVGGAAFLASTFHAPLTSALLLFELTHGYELVLPLLCAAGTGPLVFDGVERRLDEWYAERTSQKASSDCDVDNEIVCTADYD